MICALRHAATPKDPAVTLKAVEVEDLTPLFIGVAERSDVLRGDHGSPTAG